MGSRSSALALHRTCPKVSEVRTALAQVCGLHLSFTMKPTTSIAVALALSAVSSGQSHQVGWQDVFDGASHFDDWHLAACAAADGSSYATGVTFEEEFPGAGVFIPRALLRAFDPSGGVRWTRVFGLGLYGGNGYPTKVALQPSGRVVIAGAKDLGEDWFVAGYEPNGTLAFSGFWDLNSTVVMTPTDLAVDGAGALYLCGDIADATFGVTPAVAKFSANGALVWTKVLNPANELGTVRGIAVDSAGAVCVAGSLVSNGAYEFAVVRLDPAGAVQWVRTHGSSNPSGNDFGIDTTIDASGRVLAAGYVSNDAMTSMDASTIAYSASGQLLWRSDWDGPNGASEFVNAVTFDSDGRALLAGWRFNAAFEREAFAVCFAPGGALAWSRVLPFAGLDAEALTVATDGGGAALVAGIRMDSNGRTGFATALRSDGSPSGTFTFGQADGDTYFQGSTGGGPGRWIAVGQTAAPNTAPDAFALALDGPGAVAYCTAGTSGQGCAGVLAASGVASASAGSGFVLTAAGVDGQRQGLTFYGASGRTALAWGATTSFMCIKTPVQRGPLGATGGSVGACDGVLTLDWNLYIATHPGALGAPFTPGAVFQVQAWYRDPPSSKSTALTSAVEFVVQP